MLYEKKKCWSILLRLCHWFLVGSIATLTVTGFYINTPWTNTMLLGIGEFPMATIRYYHFLAGYLFSSALLARIFLLIFGNTQERFWSFLPITCRNIKNLVNETLNYLYIKESPEHRLGHNTLAGTTFFIMFILAVLQVLSGFYMLYPETLFWQKWGLTILGPQQKARFLHHLIMWGFILFTFVHVYIVVWNDLKNRDGLISSIITGDKFRPKKA